MEAADLDEPKENGMPLVRKAHSRDGFEELIQKNQMKSACHYRLQAVDYAC